LAHQSGKGAKYTKSHKPLKIVHQEQFPTKSAALKREAEIKKWTRAKKLKEFMV
jgi:putative endonuclease